MKTIKSINVAINWSEHFTTSIEGMLQCKGLFFFLVLRRAELILEVSELFNIVSGVSYIMEELRTIDAQVSLSKFSSGRSLKPIVNSIRGSDDEIFSSQQSSEKSSRASAKVSVSEHNSADGSVNTARSPQNTSVNNTTRIVSQDSAFFIIKEVVVESHDFLQSKNSSVDNLAFRVFRKMFVGIV